MQIDHFFSTSYPIWQWRGRKAMKLWFLDQLLSFHSYIDSLTTCNWAFFKLGDFWIRVYIWQNDNEVVFPFCQDKSNVSYCVSVTPFKHWALIHYMISRTTKICQKSRIRDVGCEGNHISLEIEQVPQQHHWQNACQSWDYTKSTSLDL